MFKGFYDLTSGMLTHGRWLDIISNNIANTSTAGFKVSRFTASTFGEVLWQRVGNRKKAYEEIGEQSWITAPSRLYTDHGPGALDVTDLPLDFAIDGDGYFAIQGQDADGNEVLRYTRDGSFALDEEGYLCLPGQGRVLSSGGQPLQVVTDKLDLDEAGRLYTQEGTYLGQLGAYVFEDPAEDLIPDEQGLFQIREDAQPEARAAPRIYKGMVERANTDWVAQMTEMIAAQRAYQSIAEIVGIYDSMMDRATQDVGRLG